MYEGLRSHPVKLPRIEGAVHVHACSIPSMLTAHYTGPAKPGAFSRLGWWLTRTGQKKPYAHVTHTEAIHALYNDGSVLMASSSVADHGVRVKRVVLDPSHWIVVDVPLWEVQESIDYFAKQIAAGTGYDLFGAAASLLPGKEKGNKLFCTEAVLAPFVPAAHYYFPAVGLSTCLGLGEEVTEDFFRERQALLSVA